MATKSACTCSGSTEDVNKANRATEPRNFSAWRRKRNESPIPVGCVPRCNTTSYIETVKQHADIQEERLNVFEANKKPEDTKRPVHKERQVADRKHVRHPVDLEPQNQRDHEKVHAGGDCNKDRTKSVSLPPVATPLRCTGSS